MTNKLADFKKPGNSYRGAPFWSLNHDLTDHDRLRTHIDAFEEMGLGGYHLHVRAGLKTEYLGKDFLEAAHAARDYGNSKGMLSYLYDEDTWPSGFAGGAVTTALTFRQRWLSLQRGVPDANKFCTPLCTYRVHLDKNSYLDSYERISVEACTENDWCLSLHIAPDNDRFNGAAYLDVLNPSAVDAFIASTHQKYLDSFGGSFPKDVPAIFTDEPQMARFNELETSSTGVALIPWTDDIPETFSAQWDADILNIFPEIIFPQKNAESLQRWRFWDHISERFANAFAMRIGAWCEKHGIAFTGHMMSEPSLGSQQTHLGEAMRHYHGFQIPGIDMLCDHYEPSTAKQAVSVARQDGRGAVMSELYGVTNWDFPFRGHKCQGDWQAALGVTLRVHHLAWLSMEGQSKRDYPAAIGPQSPWYKEYNLIEDHFARVNVALTSGKALVRVGVIHPIESAWLHRGVAQLDHGPFQAQEHAFSNCINWLMDGQIDFDFIAESLLPLQYQNSSDKKLHVGEMHYDVIVLPDLESIRSSTLKILKTFLDTGGSVILAGDCPRYSDGVDAKNDIEKQLALATRVDYTQNDLLDTLSPWRVIDVCLQNKLRHQNIIHQIRQVGDERILFCCHRQQESDGASPWGAPKGGAQIRMRGQWRVYELNTHSGQETLCDYRHLQNAEQTDTLITWHVEAHDHRLLRFEACKELQNAAVTKNQQWTPIYNCSEPSEVTRTEENVLLLDLAEWRVDDEEWQPAQDSVVTQLQLADRYQWPDWAQPYSVKDAGPKHRVHRRFSIHSKTAIAGARLMCERIKDATIVLNGEPINTTQQGYWVDSDLTCCAFPDLAAGTHTLEIILDIDAVDRHLEWCYLLGDFNVETRGAKACIHAASTQVNWGDVTGQGFSFYGGNLDYHFTIDVSEDGIYGLKCPRFGGSLLRVSCDGKDCGPIAFAPYRAELGHLTAGTHTIKLRAFGNRHNSFGALHNTSPGWTWWGPHAWRTEGEHQNDVWNFRPNGMLRAPILERLDTSNAGYNANYVDVAKRNSTN